MSTITGTRHIQKNLLPIISLLISIPLGLHGAPSPTLVTVNADIITPTSAGGGKTTFSQGATIEGTLTGLSATYLNGPLTVSTQSTLTGLEFAGNATIDGTLDIAGNLNTGIWHNFKGSKSITSIDTSPTEVLSITFANLAGISAPRNQGALITIYCIVSGAINGVSSINVYKGELIVSPGATTSGICRKTVLSQKTFKDIGTGTNITSKLSGRGTTAVLSLISSKTITSQLVSVFYEVSGCNLTGIDL